MARMDFFGTEEVMEELFKEAEKVEQRAGRMLEEAGRVMTDAWKDAITEAGHAPPGKSKRATGDLIGSIKADAPKKTGDVHSVQVYPHGKDRHKKRNAEVAFVLHYGTSKIPGDHFVDNAEDKGEAAAQAVMEQIWNAE